MTPYTHKNERPYPISNDYLSFALLLGLFCGEGDTSLEAFLLRLCGAEGDSSAVPKETLALAPPSTISTLWHRHVLCTPFHQATTLFWH